MVKTLKNGKNDPQMDPPRTPPQMTPQMDPLRPSWGRFLDRLPCRKDPPWGPNGHNGGSGGGGGHCHVCAWSFWWSCTWICVVGWSCTTFRGGGFVEVDRCCRRFVMSLWMFCGCRFVLSPFSFLVHEMVLSDLCVNDFW